MTRVLIVDDKEENVYYLSTLLTAHGCEVDTARDGLEALEKAHRHPPSMVISDLLMPGMDGYTLLRRWKSDPLLEKAYFIVYTATYTEPEDEQLAYDLGADAFIPKPAEPSDFVARIRAVQSTIRTVAPRDPREPLEDDQYLKKHNDALIRKLEQKTAELEESNRRLKQDIVARQLAEEALRDSEERFRQLADNVDDVFWLSNRSAEEVFYLSRAYEETWGRSRQSFFATPSAWAESVHPDDRDRFMTSLADYASGRWDETYRILRPDGTVRWIRSRAFPIRDETENVYRVAGVSRDITEYRRLEEQFRQSQKMEAVGRLAGGLAHDFNNMLSVVLSYTSLVLDELDENAPIRSDIMEVRRAGERAADLTRQLLAFSRQQMVQPQVLDLRKVVFDTEKMLRPLLGEDIVLCMRSSGSGRRIHADPSVIEQVVVNLAVNARDAMPRGGELTIDVSEVEIDPTQGVDSTQVPAGCYALLTVTDTGSGMDAPTLERIFEPFFTTKEKGKGTGLGLSTVFGIVKQSEGHIEVNSEPGRGTTFSIYLPCTDRTVTNSTSPAPSKPVTLHGSETILLVEDDEQLRAMSRMILQRNGYEVLDAADGETALALSDRFEGVIHLVLTDVVMPVMSGREMVEQLATRRPAVKVLYVSGYTEDAILHHGVFEDDIAFLQKPITPVMLLRKVREILGPP